MRHFLKLSVLGLSFLFLQTGVPVSFASDTIASGVAKPSMGYYFCVILEDPTSANPKGRAFYSGVFEAQGNTLLPVRDAYLKFLQEKYSYTPDPSTLSDSFQNNFQCTGLNNAAEATTIEGYRIASSKKLNPEGTFTTDWIFAGYKPGEVKIKPRPAIINGH